MENKPAINNNQQNNKTKPIVKIGVGVLIVGATTYGTIKTVRFIKKRKAENRADSDINVQQAMLLKAAMNPSGVSWFMWGDGTKESAIKNVASQITDLKKVSKEYRNLYARNLLDDLQKELDDNDYATFLNTVSHTGKQIASDGVQIIETGDRNWVLVRRTTKFYKYLKDFSIPFAANQEIEANSLVKGIFTGKIIDTYGLTIFNKIRAAQIAVKTASNENIYVYADVLDLMFVTKEEYRQVKQKYNKIVVIDF